MEKRTFGLWRYDLLFGLLILMTGALGLRLALLLGSDEARASSLAERQQRLRVAIPARPGNIFARAGGRYVLLAGSRQVPGCFVDPFFLKDDELDKAAIQAGQALGIDPVQVQRTFFARRRSRFVWLKRDLSDAEVRAVRSLGIPAIGISHQWRRVYPSGPLAATVLGFRRPDGQPGGGLELTQNAYLAAQPGLQVALADARRRPIWPVSEQSRPPRDGCHLLLSLDAIIQASLQQAVAQAVEDFQAKWGAGVVVDPNTGQVLAMASAPGFDPNHYAQASPEEMNNRAISMPFEPGSVMKVIFAAAARDAGLLDYHSRIFCENGVYHARRGGRITDHGKSYGWLSLQDVVVFSSNIGMAKVGEKLGNRLLHETLDRFGFGRPSGIELPGESGGIVRPLEKWDGYSLRRVPFGQEVSVTSLQLAMAFSAIANGGLLLRPHLVDRIVDPQGREVYRSRTEVIRRVLSPPAAAETLQVMRQVVERGTGKSCRLGRWTCFGKTGTAQIPGPGGYVQGAYVGTFVGGAPASDPRLLCVVSVYWPDRSRGYYGSTVAAPYVKKVLTEALSYLGVPPDKPPVGPPAASLADAGFAFPPAGER